MDLYIEDFDAAVLIGEVTTTVEPRGGWIADRGGAGRAIDIDNGAPLKPPNRGQQMRTATRTDAHHP